MNEQHQGAASSAKIINALSSEAFWAVNKAVGKAIGIENAVFLSELIGKFRYWRDRGKLQPDGGFFMTAEDIKLAMGCSDRAAKRLTQSIRESGVAEIVKRGVPAKNHWRLNWSKIGALLEGEPTSQVETVPTGEAETVPTCEAETVPTYTKNTTNNTKLKKEDPAGAGALFGEPEKSKAEPALFKRVTDLIYEAHKALTGEPLVYKGHGKAYGEAVKRIIAQAGEGSDEEVYARVRLKVEALYHLAKAEAGKPRKFWSQQGITPLSVSSNWNKLITVRNTAKTQPAQTVVFPDVAKHGEDSIRSLFTDWQKNYTAAQVHANLPREIIDEWQTVHSGFAPALVNVILAWKSRSGVTPDGKGV